MTDDTRLDARVRGVLTELPVPDDQATREALVSVLERSHGPRRRSRTWVVPALAAAAVVALVLLLATVVDRPSTTQPAPAPAEPLVGAWQHDAAGLQAPGWSGRWLLSFGKDGVLSLTGPASATDSTEGASYAVTGDRVRVDVFVNSACYEQPAGVYRWRVTAHRLVMDVVDDGCAARAELLGSEWSSVP